MKPKKINYFQKKKLQRQFPLTKELKANRKENIIVNIIIFLQLIVLSGAIYVFYLMCTYQW